MESPSKILIWFFLIFGLLWCVWFVTGGPQKEDSNKAYVSLPDSRTNTITKYGTIPALDKLDRSR